MIGDAESEAGGDSDGGHSDYDWDYYYDELDEVDQLVGEHREQGMCVIYG